MKKIYGMMGFTHSDITWEEMDVVTEVETVGEDCDGYDKSQTLGIAKNQYGEDCLFIGSTSRYGNNQFPTLVFGGGNIKKVSEILRELADKIDKVE